MDRRKFFSTLGLGGAAAVSLTSLEAIAPKAFATELRPGKQYVFRLPCRLSAEAMHELARQLEALGLKNPILIDRSIEIYELDAAPGA